MTVMQLQIILTEDDISVMCPNLCYVTY